MLLFIKRKNSNSQTVNQDNASTLTITLAGYQSGTAEADGTYGLTVSQTPMTLVGYQSGTSTADGTYALIATSLAMPFIGASA